MRVSTRSSRQPTWGKRSGCRGRRLHVARLFTQQRLPLCRRLTTSAGRHGATCRRDTRCLATRRGCAARLCCTRLALQSAYRAHHGARPLQVLHAALASVPAAAHAAAAA